jgi:transposase
MAYQTESKNMFSEENNTQETSTNAITNKLSINVEESSVDIIALTPSNSPVFGLKELVPKITEKSFSFPKLSSTKLSKKESKELKNKSIKFVVATSYNQTRNTNQQTIHQPNARTGAFNVLQNKQQMATKLQFTQPCKYLKQDDQGVWTACFREVCTFAHSLDEYKCPPCQFDKNCRFRYGRYNNQGVLDKQAACRFKHGNETVEQWCNRIQKPLPHLPQTNEETRKPKKEESLDKEPLDCPQEERRIPMHKPIVHPLVRKNKVRSASFELEHPRKEKTNRYTSDSESESDYKSRKRRERKNNKQPERIVRVPTEALAKMALTSLFEQGVFNVKVVIE